MFWFRRAPRGVGHRTGRGPPTGGGGWRVPTYVVLARTRSRGGASPTWHGGLRTDGAICSEVGVDQRWEPVAASPAGQVVATLVCMSYLGSRSEYGVAWWASPTAAPELAAAASVMSGTIAPVTMNASGGVLMRSERMCAEPPLATYVAASPQARTLAGIIERDAVEGTDFADDGTVVNPFGRRVLGGGGSRGGSPAGAHAAAAHAAGLST